MPTFQLFAHPWWVNLLILVPVVMYFLWRRGGLALSLRRKLLIAAFALAFGFVESAVVVYLRAAIGDLPGYHGTLADVRHMAATHDPAQSSSSVAFPQSLLTVEVLREAATMVMLISLALLAAPRKRERWAAFLWAFAIWDITYYGGLWAMVGWPPSIQEIDVLFLIPQPWIAQVWYPLLVSALTVLAVAISREASAAMEVRADS
jgi:hypothetical protein